MPRTITVPARTVDPIADVDVWVAAGGPVCPETTRRWLRSARWDRRWRRRGRRVAAALAAQGEDDAAAVRGALGFT